MGLLVEIFFTPGCNKCSQAREELYSVLHALRDRGVAWRDVDLLEELDYAVELGVMGASAIAIEGELVFSRLPKPAVLQRELERRLTLAAEAH